MRISNKVPPTSSIAEFVKASNPARKLAKLIKESDPLNLNCPVSRILELIEIASVQRRPHMGFWLVGILLSKLGKDQQYLSESFEAHAAKDQPYLSESFSALQKGFVASQARAKP